MRKIIFALAGIIIIVSGLIIAQDLGLISNRDESLTLNKTQRDILIQKNISSGSPSYIEYLDDDDCMIHIQDKEIDTKEYFDCSNMTTGEKTTTAKEVFERRMINIADAYLEREEAQPTPTSYVNVTLLEKK